MKDKVSKENDFVQKILNSTEADWKSFNNKGEIKLFKYVGDGHNRHNRDRLFMKGVATIRGVTAKECSAAYWNPEHVAKWDKNVDSVGRITEYNSTEFHGHTVFKTLWPLAKRDVVYRSRIYRSDDPSNPDTIRWITTCLHEEHPDVPEIPEYVRTYANAMLVCETKLQNKNLPSDRSQIETVVKYHGESAIGGPIPYMIVEPVAKRETITFLHNLVNYTKLQREAANDNSSWTDQEDDVIVRKEIEVAA